MAALSSLPPLTGVRRDALVLAAAVGLVAVTFGVLADSAGISLPMSMAMSLFVFTGASQFAVVGVIAAGGSTASAVGGALLLAARNGLYGVRMSQLLRGSLARTAATAHLVIDESTGMALARDTPEDQRAGFWWTGVGIFTFWNIGTLVGVLLGDVIGDPRVFGLDAAFPASFVALMAPHLETMAGRITAVVAAIVVVVSVPLVPAGLPVLLAALAVFPGYFLAGRVGDGSIRSALQ